MRVKIQKSPTGELLGACIALSAELMEPFKNMDYVELKPTLLNGELVLNTTNFDHSIPPNLINPIMEALK